MEDNLNLNESAAACGEDAAIRQGAEEAAGGLSVEEALNQLEELLRQMEDEGASLEKSFENYEKGIRLIRYCNDKIDQVEKKVQIMSADGSTNDFQ